jgi:hypothetical protein
MLTFDDADARHRSGQSRRLLPTHLLGQSFAGRFAIVALPYLRVSDLLSW